MILEGINIANSQTTYEIIPLETEAIKHAIATVEDGAYIIALSDVVNNAIEIVQDYLDKENEAFNVWDLYTNYKYKTAKSACFFAII